MAPFSVLGRRGVLFGVVAGCFRTFTVVSSCPASICLGILMEDENFAVAGGEVDEFGARIKGIGVHAFADWGSEDYLPVSELTTPRCLLRQPTKRRWASTSIERAVGVPHGRGARRSFTLRVLTSMWSVFVFLFEIDVEIALAVGGAVFGAAAEINGAGD